MKKMAIKYYCDIVILMFPKKFNNLKNLGQTLTPAAPPIGEIF
jgi:hypothetical protein